MTDLEESATPNTFGLMKYVHLVFFVGGVVFAWLLVNVVESVWTSLNLAVVAIPPPSGWKAIVIGTILSAGSTFYLWRHPKVNRLVVEIVTELSKVSWPTRKETSTSTVVVIVTSVIAAIILGLYDFFWAWATDLVYL